jgi:hypothetical protein
MKKIISIALALVLLLSLSLTAGAESLKGKDGLKVTFTAAEKLEPNFTASEAFGEGANTLQPGDDITMTVQTVNENDKTTDWYLSNKVVKSFEEGNAAGGAYAYLLTFTGPSGEKTIYDSATVGGEDSEGLMEATDAMDDFIYLDTLKKGETGTVTLVVTLDGETQGNDYMETLADLTLDFAVTVEETAEEVKKVVKTGDETKLFPYYVAMAASGILLAVLVVISLRKRKQEGKENAQ